MTINMRQVEHSEKPTIKVLILPIRQCYRIIGRYNYDGDIMVLLQSFRHFD